MKKLLATLAFLALPLGCKPQIPPNTPVYTCQAPTGGYTALNQSTPATGTTYTDTPTSTGEYCYVAQSVYSPSNGVSVPSNIAGPFNVTGQTGAKAVGLSWTPPTSGLTPTGYVISRVAATANAINAPTLGAGTLAERDTQKSPAPVNQKELAWAPKLSAKLQ